MVRAAVVTSANADVEICDISLPEPGPGQVRVRIAAAGVCHSDLSFINGTVKPAFPVVLGHEASGTVVEVGDGVTKVRAGDRVVLNWAPACRSCWFCEAGEPWLCTVVERAGASLAQGTLADGTALNVALGLGAFAEEVVVAENAIVPLPDGVPLDLAALLGCAVLTGVGAVRNTAQVRPGQSVVVIGLGGIGLSAIMGARLAQAGTIVGVDVSPEKEELARAAGATHFLISGPDLSKEVRGLTEGRGADHVFECVGRASTIRAAWKSARRGGHCTIVGVGRKEDVVSFHAMELFHFARTLTSSVYGSGDPERDIPILAGHVRAGTLDLEALVTHRVTLEEIPAAFSRMEHGQGARSIVILDADAVAR